MLQVSQTQMALFDAQIETAFAARLGRELMRFFPFRFGVDGLGSPEVFALSCVRHAKRLGLRREVAITRYANLCTLLQVGFESNSFARSAALSPTGTEALDPAWLDRIVPLVEQMLRERR